MSEHDRRQGIGSSEAAAILGWSKFQSPLEVYQHKVAEEPQGFHDAVPNSPMYWGQKLEDAILAEYELREGTTVISRQKRFGRGLFWATVDGINASHMGEKIGVAVVNAKCSRSDSDWGDPEAGEVPLYYVGQGIIEMHCTDLPEWHCPVLFAGQRLEIYKVKRDLDAERDLLQALTDWWERHVVARVPPEPITEKDLAIAYPRNMGTLVEASLDEIEQINKLRDVKAQISTLDVQKEALEIALKRKIGEADALVHEGNILATWKISTRKGYTVQEKTFRQFRVK